MPKFIPIAFIILLIAIPLIFLLIKDTTLRPQEILNQVQDSSPPPTNTTPIQPPKVSADEEYVLSVVTKVRTDEENKKFAEALYNASKTVDELNITSCSPTPVVLKIAINKQLVVKNDDSSAHTLTINNKNIAIPAKQTTNITVDFPPDMLHTYSCDQKTVAGVLHVTK